MGKIGPSVLFRCDGSPEIGLGHVVRCLALADELRETHDCRIAFVMRHGPLVFEMVHQKGYPVLTPSDGGQPFDYGQWLGEAMGHWAAQALVLDIRDDLPRSALEELRRQGVLVVTLDDPSERRLASDLAFYPPVPQVQRMDWAGFTGQLYVGWEWVVLRQEFGHRPPRVPHERPVVLVTMGGSDPAGLTLKAVEALDLLVEDFETIVALGPGFGHHEALRDLLARARRRFDVCQSVTDMPGLMAQADLAVASFGVTSYELAAMGVPAIYLCLTEDHAESAAVFVNAGIALSLGQYGKVIGPDLAQTIRTLLVNGPRRRQMAERARQCVDGQGTGHIARIFVRAIRERDAERER